MPKGLTPVLKSNHHRAERKRRPAPQSRRCIATTCPQTQPAKTAAKESIVIGLVSVKRMSRHTPRQLSRLQE